MKIGAIIQARTSSTRLPQKVLKPLPFNSKTNVLQQVIRRVSKSELIDEIIIATTTHDEDEKIVGVAKKENIKFYKGSLENVLERYYNAALENSLDVVVRITSDCPCADANIIDEIIKKHIDSDADYTSNTLTRGFPRGIDAEVINFSVLEKAYENVTDKFEKEHVTPFIYKTHPEDFKIVQYETKNDNSDIRITLDTPQDYALLCSVYDNLYDTKGDCRKPLLCNSLPFYPFLYLLPAVITRILSRSLPAAPSFVIRGSEISSSRVINVSTFVSPWNPAPSTFTLFAATISKFFFTSFALEFSITFWVSMENPHKNCPVGLCSPRYFRISSVLSNSMDICPSLFLTFSSLTFAGR